jgi:type IV secretory pathway TrbD component
LIKFWLVGAETCASAAARANPCVFDVQIRKVRFAAENEF